jgi:hypothetical protein
MPLVDVIKRCCVILVARITQQQQQIRRRKGSKNTNLFHAFNYNMNVITTKKERLKKHKVVSSF